MSQDLGSGVIAAFSEDHVRRLTGLSVGQLRYWDRTGFFTPSFGSNDQRAIYGRNYSFRDIASLRVIHALRNEYKVPLQQLRIVKQRLADLEDAGWSSARLFVMNKRVIWETLDSTSPEDILAGQYILRIHLREIVENTKRDLKTLIERDRATIGKVVPRDRLHGVPMVAGTRIPVVALKNFARAGFSIEQINAEYPDLDKRDIEAALAYRDERSAA